MATNVYGATDGSTATVGQQTIVHYYDRAGVNAANRVNVYQQFADRKSMPQKYGKTFKISRFEHMYDRAFSNGDFAAKGFMTGRTLDELNAILDDNGTGALLNEGDGAVNKRSLKKVTYSTEFARYGEMLDYTDEVDIWSEDYVQVRYREELGELANSRMEDLIQRDMLADGITLGAGTANTASEIGTGAAADGSDDADWKVSYDLIRKAVRTLVRNRAKKNSMIVTGSTKIGTAPIAKAYYAIIGADVKSDLETLTRGSTYETEYVFVPAHKYADASTLAEGEVGAMHEVRFIESESAIIENGAVPPVDYVGTLATHNVTNASSATPADRGFFSAFPILFPTEGAFATVGLKGLEKIKFNSKSPAEVENGNPYGTNGFFSYNFFYAGIALRPECLLKVTVAATA